MCKKNLFFCFLVNCTIQRSIMVSCITSQLQCHLELKGACFNVICQPLVNTFSTCNILIVSFLDLAFNPNNSGKLITSLVVSEWNQIAGHELQPQKSQQEPGWDMINRRCFVHLQSLDIPAFMRVV